MVTSLHTPYPDIPTLEKIKVESLDIANYALFIAVTVELVLLNRAEIEQPESQEINGEKDNSKPWPTIIGVLTNGNVCALTENVCYRTVRERPEERNPNNLHCWRSEHNCTQSWKGETK